MYWSIAQKYNFTWSTWRSTKQKPQSLLHETAMRLYRYALSPWHNNSRKINSTKTLTDHEIFQTDLSKIQQLVDFLLVNSKRVE